MTILICLNDLQLYKVYWSVVHILSFIVIFTWKKIIFLFFFMFKHFKYTCKSNISPPPTCHYSVFFHFYRVKIVLTRTFCFRSRFRTSVGHRCHQHHRTDTTNAVAEIWFFSSRRGGQEGVPSAYSLPGNHKRRRNRVLWRS